MSVSARISWNSVISFFSLAGIQIVKFVSNILFVNIAGAAAVGVYYVFLSAYRLLNRVTTLGLSKAIVKRISEREVNESRQFSDIVVSAFAIRTVPLLALTVGLFAFDGMVDDYVGISNAWMYIAATLWFTAVYSTFRSTLLARRRVDLASSFDLLKDLSITGIQVILIIVGYTAGGLIFGFTVGLLISTLPLFAYVQLDLKGASLDFGRVKSLLSFAKFAYVDYLVGPEHRWVDIAILGFFVSTEAIGVYGVAYALAQFGLVFSVALSRNVLPEISHLSSMEDDEARQSVVKRTLSYSTLLAVPIFTGSIVIADRLLADIYQFDTGAVSLIILALSTIFYGAYQQIHQLLFGLDVPQYALGLSVIATITNVTVAVALIPVFGIAGAAISTTASTLVAFFVGLYVVYDHTELTLPFPVRSWGLQLVAGVVMMAAVWFVRSRIVLEARFYSAFLTLIGGVVYFTVILSTDSFLRSQIRRLLGRFVSS